MMKLGIEKRQLGTLTNLTITTTISLRGATTQIETSSTHEGGTTTVQECDSVYYKMELPKVFEQS
jgi:hypothetical protein